MVRKAIKLKRKNEAVEELPPSLPVEQIKVEEAEQEAPAPIIQPVVQPAPQVAAPPARKANKYIKTKKTLVIRPDGIMFENIAEPKGEVWIFEEIRSLPMLRWNFAKWIWRWIDMRNTPCYVMIEKEDGTLEAYVPPDDINYLPDKLYRAHKGCQSYSNLMSLHFGMMEKIKVLLMAGVVLGIVFFAFLIVNPK